MCVYGDEFERKWSQVRAISFLLLFSATLTDCSVAALSFQVTPHNAVIPKINLA